MGYKVTRVCDVLDYISREPLGNAKSQRRFASTTPTRMNPRISHANSHDLFKWGTET